MSTLASLNAKVLTRIQDSDSLLTSAQRDDAVHHAARTYSTHRPRTMLADLAGDGTNYDYTLPATWATGLSSLKSIEFPAGSREPEYLEAEDYTLYQSTSLLTKLRFLTSTPQSGQSARLTFTAPHRVSLGSTVQVNGAVAAGASTLAIDGVPLTGYLVAGDTFTIGAATTLYTVTNASPVVASQNAMTGITFSPVAVAGGFADNAAFVFTTTIPDNDEDAVCDLGAAVCCEWLSSRFSQQGEPTLSADSADHTSKARDFALRARAFRQAYYRHLGIPYSEGTDARTGQASAPVAAASAVREWDGLFSAGGDRLTHGRRGR
jgi:hypothetical protein